ncbi:MAG: RDD family protein [Acidobacteria bacterium]|nr:RDD family protein [Acidobacteriota bacterium]
MKPEQVLFTGLWVSCPVCGHRNADAEPRCEKCGRRLPPGPGREEGSVLRPVAPSTPPQTSAPAAPASPRILRDPQRPGSNSLGTSARRDPGFPAGVPALPPQLRRQLSARVQEFRTRRSNPTLPFAPAEEELPESKVVPIRVEPRRRETRGPGKPGRGTGDRPRRSASPTDQQPALEFLSAVAPSEPVAIPPVAPFHRRMIASGLDLALILAAALAFFLFLRLVAGSVTVDRFLLAGGLCAVILLTLLYGGMFLYEAGTTPGMKWLGLRLVNFDGRPAPRRQRLWRLAGTMVSAGSFFLGYLWAAFDEEGLFWHDRISKTFLTAANDPGVIPSPSHRAPAALPRR